MKTVIVLFMLAIVAALAGAGVFMLRRSRPGDPHGANMARALALRVGLSIVLFVLLLFSYWMGWIKPSGIPLGN